jgi:hypothetical protein
MNQRSMTPDEPEDIAVVDVDDGSEQAVSASSGRQPSPTRRRSSGAKPRPEPVERARPESLESAAAFNPTSRGDENGEVM